MKQLDKIKKIQKFQKAYTALTSRLFDTIKNEEPDDFKKLVLYYLLKQQRLNTEFSIDLLKAIPREIDKDRFNDIVKPLEKDTNNKDK